MIDSVKDIVDEFIIVDTGSEDSTKEIIKKYGDLYQIKFVNFVETKNRALGLATSDYILFMDADERIYKGLHKLASYADGKTVAVSCKITEGPNNNDEVVCNQYDRIRLFKNNMGWKFYGPGVHEYLLGPGEVVKDYDILVRHEHIKTGKAESSRERFLRYIELLKEATEKNDEDCRAWFYLARTYKDLGENAQSISYYLKYLSIPNNNFRDEKWQANYDVAVCYKLLGEYYKSISYIERSIDICERVESYALLGDIFLQEQKYKKAIKAYVRGLEIDNPKDIILFVDPNKKQYIKDQLVLAYYEDKQFDKAEEICFELVKNSLDTRLNENLWWCRTRTKMKIFLTLGQTPESIYGGILDNQGVHGVETTYIELANEFSKLGHFVYLFCSTEKEHIYNNVYYVPYENINDYIFLNPDVIITSRWFDALYLENNSKKIIWLQDSHFADPNRPDAFQVANLIVCSSYWHKNYISERYGKGVDQNKVKVIPLGIRKELYNDLVSRDWNKVIYSSNPDRGLYHLADMWEEITKRCPNIHLSICYGWEGLRTWGQGNIEWEKSVREQQKKVTEKLLSFDNVSFKGRLTKKELAKEMMSVGMLLYPNNFPETFCLTVYEARCAGLVTITTNSAALTTTTSPNDILIEGSPFTKEYQKKFIEETEKLFNDKAELNNKSLKNRHLLFSNCDWKDIAISWQTTIWSLM
jgi:tetratricopeptide (TPR) repeat protein